MADRRIAETLNSLASLLRHLMVFRQTERAADAPAQQSPSSDASRLPERIADALAKSDIGKSLRDVSERAGHQQAGRGATNSPAAASRLKRFPGVSQERTRFNPPAPRGLLPAVLKPRGDKPDTYGAVQGLLGSMSGLPGVGSHLGHAAAMMQQVRGIAEAWQRLQSVIGALNPGPANAPAKIFGAPLKPRAPGSSPIGQLLNMKQKRPPVPPRVRPTRTRLAGPAGSAPPPPSPDAAWAPPPVRRQTQLAAPGGSPPVLVEDVEVQGERRGFRRAEKYGKLAGERITKDRAEAARLSRIGEGAERDRRQNLAVRANRFNREAMARAKAPVLPSVAARPRAAASRFPVEDFSEPGNNLKRFSGYGRTLEKRFAAEDKRRATEVASLPRPERQERVEPTFLAPRKQSRVRRQEPGPPELPEAPPSGLVDFGRAPPGRRSRPKTAVLPPVGTTPRPSSPDVLAGGAVTETRTQPRTPAAPPSRLARKRQGERTAAVSSLAPVPKRGEPGHSMLAGRVPRATPPEGIKAPAALKRKRRREKGEAWPVDLAMPGEQQGPTFEEASEAGRTLALWGHKLRRSRAAMPAAEGSGVGLGAGSQGRRRQRGQGLGPEALTGITGGPGTMTAGPGGGELLVVMRELADAVESLSKKIDKTGDRQREQEPQRQPPGPGGATANQVVRQMGRALGRGKQPGGGTEDMTRTIVEVLKIAGTLAI